MTAVQELKYLFDIILKDRGVFIDWDTYLAQEKQQIMDAYNVGSPYKTAEQYYTSIYGSKGSDDHIVDTDEMVSEEDEKTNSQRFDEFKVYTHQDVLKLMKIIHVYEINRDLCMLKLTPIDMEEKLLEYWNGGIKSTEEGGKSFDQYHNEHHEDNLVEIPTSSQTEISDEEIEKAARDYDNAVIYGPPLVHFEQGAFWYREQLKQRQ